MSIIKKSTKKVFSTMLALLIVISIFTVLPITANAYGDYTDENGLTYILHDDNTATVIDYNEAKTDIVIPSVVNNYYTVTEIEENVFTNCKKVESIIIPDTVTTIYGDKGFENCISLKNIDLGGGITQFGCQMFSNCQSLETITIPEQITSIGLAYGYDSYFPGCTSLHTINFNAKECDYIDTEAFKIPSLKTLNIGSTVEYLGSGAFENCSNLETVNFESGLMEIPSLTFYGCTGLKNVNFSNTITKIGDQAFKNCFSLKNVTLPNRLSTIDVCAFANCKSLQSLSLPNSVSELGDSCFAGCTSLKSIELSDNISVLNGGLFYNCSSLESITIPKNITKINKYSCYYEFDYGLDCDTEYNDKIIFEGCNNLKTLNYNAKNCKQGSYGEYYDDDYYEYDGYYEDSVFKIPSLKTLNIGSDVEVLPKGMFIGCTNFEDINFASDSSLQSIDGRTFYGCENIKQINLPNSVMAVGKEAFANCSSMETLTLSNSLSTISEKAFENCSSLKNLTLPTSVRTIKANAFYNCSSLSAIEINNGVTGIEEYAFGKCTSLKTVNLPSTLSSMGKCVFYGDTSLTSATLPSKLTDIEQETFYECSSLKNISIPQNVKSIGDSAFYNCKSLSKITFNKKLQRIGESAFKNCTSLTTVSIPSSVSEIYSNAFDGCKKLSKLTIPNGVNSIYSYAFFNCTSLKEVVLPQSINSLDEYSFGFYGNVSSQYKLSGFRIGSNNQVVSDYGYEYEINVCPLPTYVKINDKSVTLGKGEGYTVSAKTSTGLYTNYSTLSWSSSNTKVATIKKISGSKAKIIAKGIGTAYITVKTKNNKTHKIKVTVKNAPKKVAFSKSKMYVRAGHIYETKIKINSGSYANIKNIKCSSTNKKVANIYKTAYNNKYVVCAYKKGTTYLKVTLYNGKTARCKVIVQ